MANSARLKQHLETLCKLVNFYLWPFIENLPSYIKDTGQLLRKMDGIRLEQDICLVTCDESLYILIRHNDDTAMTQFQLSSINLDVEISHFIHEAYPYTYSSKGQ